MGIQGEATETGRPPEHGSRFQAKGAPSLAPFRRGVNPKRGKWRLAPTLLSVPASQLSVPASQLSVLTAHIEVPKLHKSLATELQATHMMSHIILMRDGWVQEGSKCKLFQPKILKVAARLLEQGS